jgi:hypothetical protein
MKQLLGIGILVLIVAACSSNKDGSRTGAGTGGGGRAARNVGDGGTAVKDDVVDLDEGENAPE